MHDTLKPRISTAWLFRYRWVLRNIEPALNYDQKILNKSEGHVDILSVKTYGGHFDILSVKTYGGHFQNGIKSTYYVMLYFKF